MEVDYYGDDQLKLAGPGTVMAEVCLYDGTPRQERKVIVLQMVGKAEGAVYIGSFTF